jgi:hypothetical protein
MPAVTSDSLMSLSEASQGGIEMKRVAIVIAALAVVWQPGSIAYQATERQVYRLTFDYYYVSLDGNVNRRERVSGEYTRDLGQKSVTWHDVTLVSSRGMEAFGPAQPRNMMEGFTYPVGAPNMTKPEFFVSIPTATLQDKDLVFDARMFEIFGEGEFEHLKPNVAYSFSGNGVSVPLAGAGTFTNKDVQLTLTGTTVRDGVLCAVVDYRALFNPVQLELPNMKMHGRSHYWGQIWVALPEKRIEYGTLYEDVLGEVGDGKTSPQPINVFRIGTLERQPLR